MKHLILLFFAFATFSLSAQEIQFLDLPSFFNREFEISGLTGNKQNLFLPAERCGKIFVVKKKDMSHVRTIHLDMGVLSDGIEIEGLCIYKDFLIFTDEKHGNLYSYGLKTNILKRIIPKGKDLSSFTGEYGMEGIAVDKHSNILYLLREKNEKNQSEIHSFAITEKEGSLQLDYRNETTIQQQDAHWRYTGLTVDYKKNRLLCLKSYYLINQPTLNQREIDYLPLDSLKRNALTPNMLVSLTKEIYFMRDSFATNVEGIYTDGKFIYITSDNGEGVKDCSQLSSKTIMIRVKMD